MVVVKMAFSKVIPIGKYL